MIKNDLKKWFKKNDLKKWLKIIKNDLKKND